MPRLFYNFTWKGKRKRLKVMTVIFKLRLMNTGVKEGRFSPLFELQTLVKLPWLTIIGKNIHKKIKENGPMIF